MHHLALAVASPEAQLMWKRRLRDEGVPVSGPYDRGYFRSIYFSDPDGQILEIATEGPGYAVDEPTDSLGERLIRPDPIRLKAGRDETAIRQATHPEPVPGVTPEMRLSGIHHISGITDDLDRAGDFLESALGLRLVKRTYNQDDGETLHYFWAHYESGRVSPLSSYTLFGWPGSRYFTRPGAGQTHHVAFRSRNEVEQLAWRDHLVGLGIDVTPVQDRHYFKSIYFRAPDGMLMEIATDGPGFGVDEPIEALGTALQLPPTLEPERARIESALTQLD